MRSMWIRRGILGQRTYIVPVAKVQSAEVTANPFVVPSADVPAAQGGQDVPFGQTSG